MILNIPWIEDVAAHYLENRKKGSTSAQAKQNVRYVTAQKTAVV